MTQELVADFMFGELRDALLTEIKALGNPWPMMPQQEQDEVIERIDGQVKDVIERAADTLAAHEFPIIAGQLDTITIKDGIKAVIKVPMHEKQRYELVDAVGSKIRLVVVDTEQFIGGGEITSDSDQHELPLQE